MESNFDCPHDNCGAKLLQKRVRLPPKPRGAAFCPYCMNELPEREGEFLLVYELVSAPPRREVEF
jgi:hypothetical protein